MIRVTVFHNPTAGDETHNSRQLRKLLIGAGYKPTFRSTKAKKWKQALTDPGDLVVAVGGDGTVARVAKQLAGRGVPMAIIPVGTANNIARSLEIEGEPEELIARWTTARTRPLDLGIARGSFGERYFIEALGLGLLPWLMTESDRQIDKDDATASEQITKNVELMIGLLESAKPVRCRLTVDGRDHSGSYLILEVMNIRSVGPRIELAPAADLGDGLLEIITITEGDRAATLDFLERFRNGSSSVLTAGRVRGKLVELEWERWPIHVDDEQWPDPDDDPPNDGGSFSATLALAQGAISVLQ